MKIRRIDTISLIISFFINIIILFLIPGLKIQEVMNKKLKVGLVSLESNRKKATTEKKTKNTISKVDIQKSKKEVLPVEKKPIVEKKVEAVKKVEKKIITLEDLEKSISGPGIDILAMDTNAVRKENKVIKKDLIGEKTQERFKEESLLDENKISLETETPVKEDEALFQIDSQDKIAINPDAKEVIDFGKVYDVSSENDGLPSGYKLGVEDGDIIAKWDTSNKEPSYPETAQLRGMQGTVKLRMKIDERGNVISLNLEKGSGVPEINSSIEEIARSWKVYLSKNGLNIRGDVVLEYNFRLVGAS